MENRNILQTAFIGGVMIALLGAIPFADACCCLFYPGGGALSLFLYNRYFLNNQDEITVALAILLGIATGLTGALLSLFVDWLTYLLFGYYEFEIAKQLIENMDEIPVYMQEMFSEFEKQKTHGFIWAGPLLTNLFVMPLFCIAGSLITRVFLLNLKSKQGKNPTS
jgi:fructose-specific phosphotransferase system IIC component